MGMEYNMKSIKLFLFVLIMLTAFCSCRKSDSTNKESKIFYGVDHLYPALKDCLKITAINIPKSLVNINDLSNDDRNANLLNEPKVIRLLRKGFKY